MPEWIYEDATKAFAQILLKKSINSKWLLHFKNRDSLLDTFQWYTDSYSRTTVLEANTVHIIHLFI